MKVKTLLDPEKLQRDLGINSNDLTDAFLRQAGYFSYYSSLAHQAGRQFENFKQLQNLIEAKVDKAIRDNAVQCGEKVTEPQIARMIDSHPKVIKARWDVNEAQMIYRICRDAVESFKQRRDMLIQHGASEREEKKGQVRMMEMSPRRRAKENFERTMRRQSES